MKIQENQLLPPGQNAQLTTIFEAIPQLYFQCGTNGTIILAMIQAPTVPISRPIAKGCRMGLVVLLRLLDAGLLGLLHLGALLRLKVAEAFRCRSSFQRASGGRL